MTIAKNDLINALEKLKQDYIAAHSVKIHIPFSNAKAKLDIIEKYIAEANKLNSNQDKNDFIDKLIDDFDAHAKKSGLRREQYVEQMQKHPEDHTFYRGIGLIIKTDCDRLIGFGSLDKVEENKESKESHRPSF